MKTSPLLPVPIRSTFPFLLAGFLSFLLSVWLYFGADETTAGIFVGLWVPSILSLGILLHLPVADQSVAVQSVAAPRTGARR